jgi:hypothetical protein
LKSLHNKFTAEPYLVREIIIAVAMRGPRKAAELKLSNGRRIDSYGIPQSGLQGRRSEELSLNRISASTADLAAHFLKRMNFPKRLNVVCPGWLQFPTAGSIRMPENYREMHREFSKKFSPMLINKEKKMNGEFNETIYSQMEHNSYCDPNLKLFE